VKAVEHQDAIGACHENKTPLVSVHCHTARTILAAGDFPHHNRRVAGDVNDDRLVSIFEARVVGR
jgi:hypothetical protein